MDSILVVDTSGSMAGTSIRELKRAMENFIDTYQQVGLDAQIAIVEFGNNIGIRCPFTRDYRRLKRVTQSLSAGGSTPMAQGLTEALRELANNGRVAMIHGIPLFPRIILMTDGQPDNQQEVLAVAALIGQAGFPIACVGVTGCNQQLMFRVAALTEGMFLMVHNIEGLTLFFLQQIVIILYIAQVAEEIENLLNRELLREFLQEKTGQPVSDLELDAFLKYLEGLAKKRQGGGRGGTGARPCAIQASPSNYGSNYGRPQPPQPSGGSCCCCTIL